MFVFPALGGVFVAVSVVSGNPESDGHKPVPVLYPQGDVFCFTFYSTKPEDTSLVLKHGATAIGPYYGDQANSLSSAAEQDTTFIFKINLPCMAGKSFTKSNVVMPEDRTIIAETAAVINAVKDNPHIAYWDIVPEELRHWKKNEMHYVHLVLFLSA